MTTERTLLVARMISLCIDNGEPLHNARQYGASFKVTKKEVETVAAMTLKQLIELAREHQ